jgi:hypothetical protein
VIIIGYPLGLGVRVTGYIELEMTLPAHSSSLIARHICLFIGVGIMRISLTQAVPAALLLAAAIGVIVTWRSSMQLRKGPISLLEDLGKYDPEVTPKKIYQDPKDHDFDHTNRIDNYDCFFNACDEGNSDSLVGTGLYFQWR